MINQPKGWHQIALIITYFYWVARLISSYNDLSLKPIGFQERAVYPNWTCIDKSGFVFATQILVGLHLQQAAFRSLYFKSQVTAGIEVINCNFG